MMKRFTLILTAMLIATISQAQVGKRLAAISDEKGRQVEFQYDSQDRIVQSTYSRPGSETQTVQIDWDNCQYFRDDETGTFASDNGFISNISEYWVTDWGNQNSTSAFYYTGNKLSSWTYGYFDEEDGVDEVIEMNELTWEDGNLICSKEYKRGELEQEARIEYGEETGQPEFLHGGFTVMTAWLLYPSVLDFFLPSFTYFQQNMGIASKQLPRHIDYDFWDKGVYDGSGYLDITYEKDVSGLITTAKIVSKGNESDADYFYFTWEDTTGIAEISAEQPATTAFYDLQGRKTSHPQRGIYIVDGKKRVVK